MSNPPDSDALDPTTPPHPTENWNWRSLTCLAAIAWLGYGLGSALGFPLASLTGSVSLVGIAAFAGAPMAMPVSLRNAAFMVLGVILGSMVTMETLAASRDWLWSFLLLGACMGVTIAVGCWFLHRLYGYDLKTSALSSCPGYMSYVLVTADEVGADVPTVSVIQSVRLLSLVLLLPLTARFFGIDLTLFEAAEEVGPEIGIFIGGMVAAAALGWGLRRLRVPASWLQGGLMSGMFFGLSGMGPVVPLWLATAAFVAIGAVIGSRFAGMRLREVWRSLIAGTLLTIVMLWLSILTAAFAFYALGLDVMTAALSYAPGGIETMGLFASVSGANVLVVTAHHLVRLFYLGFYISIFLAYVNRSRR